jgi:hypothetical protein
VRCSGRTSAAVRPGGSGRWEAHSRPAIYLTAGPVGAPPKSASAGRPQLPGRAADGCMAAATRTCDSRLPRTRHRSGRRRRAGLRLRFPSGSSSFSTGSGRRPARRRRGKLVSSPCTPPCLISHGGSGRSGRTRRGFVPPRFTEAQVGGDALAAARTRLTDKRSCRGRTAGTTAGRFGRERTGTARLKRLPSRTRTATSYRRTSARTARSCRRSCHSNRRRRGNSPRTQTRPQRGSRRTWANRRSDSSTAMKSDNSFRSRRPAGPPRGTRLRRRRCRRRIDRRMAERPSRQRSQLVGAGACSGRW